VRLDLPELGPVHAERVAMPAPDAGLPARLARLSRVALLDSASGGRFAVAAAAPLMRLRWSAGRGGTLLLPGGPRASEPDVRVLLEEALRATRVDRGLPLPYGPGWIGSLGYGLRRAFERVPERHEDELRAGGIDDVDLSYYPAVAVHDRGEDCWWMIWRDEFADQARTLRACLHHPAPEPEGRVLREARPRIDREAYLAAVRRAIEYIHAGDVFQVNFAHEFRAPWAGHPLALYARLRESNPAPYCAFLDLGADRAVLSTSPELFLRLRGDEVVTRPIKGTRPRGADRARDEMLVEELRASEKDAAELAMIVDLERNDLGRVCAPGSVIVRDPARIESYASVHHRVAEVAGTLESGCTAIDLLAATFPGGSITGAPKVRAMEIIDELESAPRGPYTGSIGILADDGGMELNIAIRTVVLAGGEARLHVGGGIVADSDPGAEYQETLDKGRAMFEALRP